MLTMTDISGAWPMREPDDLPANPDEIDLDRVVADPCYRAAVIELLRKWGLCGGRANRRLEN